MTRVSLKSTLLTCRLEAAKYLNLTEVPIIRLEHLSEKQAKAYMLADNKLTDRSSWDDTQLALRLKELQSIVIDFEIEATGFDESDDDGNTAYRAADGCKVGKSHDKSPPKRPMLAADGTRGQAAKARSTRPRKVFIAL